MRKLIAHRTGGMQKIQSLRCVRSGIGEDCTHAEAALAKRVIALKNLVIFLKGMHFPACKLLVLSPAHLLDEFITPLILFCILSPCLLPLLPRTRPTSRGIRVWPICGAWQRCWCWHFMRFIVFSGYGSRNRRPGPWGGWPRGIRG